MSVSKYHKLTPFEVGQVKAHLEHGLKAPAICERVLRADNKTPFGETAIRNCINKLEAEPGWRGEREAGTGPERKTTAKQDKQIIKWVLDHRGKKKVTVTRLKKRFPYLRKLSDTLVEERLSEADLEWLRRRKKCIVTKEYLAERKHFCKGVKRKHENTLLKLAYTDGTVYYLDRTEAEHEDSVRAALGTHVWRRSENRDALTQDCLGPSSYAKAQGIPIRVWGMLAGGALHIHVLDAGEVMNTELYVELVEDKFEAWAGVCEQLVCDFEKCLRGEEAVRALEGINLTLLEDYPRCSQDFNAIENAWDILKSRLAETVPVNLESREAFIKRLHAAVKWANQHRKEQLWYLSTNLKERAADCLATKPKGGRTQ